MDKFTEGRTFFLDFVKSDDPEEIDQGIRDAIRGFNISILSMGIGLARLKSEGLYKKLNFRSMHAYINHICSDTKTDRSTMYNWFKIGKVFLKHQNDLEEIGFSDKNSPTKLPYLDRALMARDKEEVYRNLMNMSKDDFIRYAKTGQEKNTRSDQYWESRGNIFYHRGSRAIIINKNLNKRKTRMLKAAVSIAFRALETNGHVVAVHLRNAKEARRFRAEAKRIRAKLRKKDSPQGISNHG